MLDNLSIIVTSLVLMSALGVVIAFSPTLVITELTILTRSKNPIIQSIAFIAGIASAITLFCLIAVLFIDPSFRIAIPSTREVIKEIPLMDILIGILLVITGSRVSQPKPASETTKQPRFKPEKLLNTKTLLWFGFIKMATSLSSLAAILFASRFVKTSIDAGTLQFASVLWLIGAAILPFILILLLKQYRPSSFARIQSASDKAVSFNWRRVIAITLVVLGIYFVLSGLLHLS